MDIKELFKNVRTLINQNDFGRLSSLNPVKPENFNWYSDIFEPLNIQSDPGGKALVWIYNQERRDYSFEDLGQKANQFLNFLRKHGIEKGDKMFAQLPLIPMNWISYLGCIKGGVIIVPTATTMPVRDLQFRFTSIFPELVIADADNAAKIDKAEEGFDSDI